MNEKKLNKKYLKIGSYSIAVCAVVCAIVILINMLVGEIPSVYTKYDFSSLNLFSIGDETAEILAGVDEDVNVYILTARGSESQTTVEFLERYSGMNSHIKVSTVDPVTNPGFVEKYTDNELSDNSVIFESAKRSYVIDYNDIYPRQYSDEELYYYYYSGQIPAGTPYFNGELMFTTAVDYVTRDDLPVMYALTGHGETELDSTYASYISSENIATNELSLLTADEIPRDCTSILINVPTSDISADECEKLEKYLDEGGNIILVTGAVTYTSYSMPNITALCAYMGLESVDGMVVEGNRNNYLYDPRYLLPVLGTTYDGPLSLLSSSKIYTLMYASHGILDIGTHEVTPLMSSTTSAFVKENFLTDNSVTKSDGDISGMVYVGAAVTGEADGTRAENYKFVWFSSPSITDSSADSYVSGGNSAVFTSTLNWMSASKTNLSIMAKQMQVEALVIPESASAFWSVAVVFIVPISVFICGFVAWFKRRRK